MVLIKSEVLLISTDSYDLMKNWLRLSFYYIQIPTLKLIMPQQSDSIEIAFYDVSVFHHENFPKVEITVTAQSFYMK